MIGPEDVPRRLRMARSGANLSRAEVARHLEVAEHTISNWENGKTQITLSTALRLCELYNVNIGELTGDVEFQAAVIEIRRASKQLERVEAFLDKLEERGT